MEGGDVGAKQWIGLTLTGSIQRWLPKKKCGFVIPDDEALVVDNGGNLLVDEADVITQSAEQPTDTQAGVSNTANAGHLLRKRQPVRFVVVRAHASSRARLCERLLARMFVHVLQCRHAVLHCAHCMHR